MTTLTKAERAAWSARLRDPASKQCFGRMRAGNYHDVIDHGFISIYGELVKGGCGTFIRQSMMDGKIGVEMSEELRRMNDEDRLSLALLADYVDRLPTCEDATA